MKVCIAGLGAIGGLFTARNDLEPAKRELGQLAIAMADAMNMQPGSITVSEQGLVIGLVLKPL